METSEDMKLRELIQKGVQIPNPQSVQIGKEVDCGNISGNDVTIYSGCKIFGKSTVILHGAQLGDRVGPSSDSGHVPHRRPLGNPSRPPGMSDPQLPRVREIR